MPLKDFQPVVCYSKRLASQQAGNQTYYQQAILFNCYSNHRQAKIMGAICSVQQFLCAEGQPVLDAELTHENEL